MSPGRPPRAKIWLGVAFGIGCIVLFSWNAHWEEIGQVLAQADLPLTAVAALFLLMTSVARAWRWRHLLPGAEVSFRHRLTSTLIGFAGNNVLPGRLGEPLRCWVLGRLDRRIGFWQAAGSVLIERVFDLSAAVIALVGFLLLAPFPANARVRDAAFLTRLEANAALVAVAIAIALGALVVVTRRRMRGGTGRLSRVAGALGSLQEGFAGVRSLRALMAAAFLTVVLWTSMLLFEFSMLRAFGFTELGPAHALGLLVVLSFAIALPQAPAGVGVVQLASETTLTALYGMPLTRAKAFAIGLWACQVGVVVGAGAVALWVEGLSLGEMRRARGSLDRLEGIPPPE